jgi:hypothetical protein
VVRVDAGDSRKATAAATSAAVKAQPPSGWSSGRRPAMRSSSSARLAIGVSTSPAATRFTLVPPAATSMAAVRTRLASPPLLAA